MSISVTSLRTPSSWSQDTSTVLEIKFTNDGNTPYTLNSFTVQIGTGDTTNTDGIVSITGGVHRASGGTITASLKGDFSGSAEVTQSVQVESRDGSSGGYFYDIGGNSRYNITFTVNKLFSAGESYTAQIYKSSSGGLITTRRYDSQQVSISQTQYKPPITGSVIINAIDKTVLYGETTSVSYIIMPNHIPPGYQQTITGGGSLGAITGQKTGTVSVTITHPDYTGSLTDSDTYTISCKLNPPTTSLSSSTGGLTVGTSVSPTVSEGNNPSGCTRFYQVSLNNSSTWSSVNVPYPLNSGTSVRFRSWLSKSGYVSSDPGSASPSVGIYYEPRNMSTNGFSVSYKYTPPGGTETNLPIGDNVAVPTGTVKINWSSFLASKNLGRFNYYKVYVYKEGTTTNPLASQSGSNDPNSSKSQTFTISPDWAGQRIYLKLECLCRWPDSTSGSFYGPNTSTGVFTSSSFLVGGYPEVPVVKYPSSTTFSSANKRLRLVFTVSNPSYLSDWDITDIEVEVKGTSTRTYKYSTSPAHFYSKMTTKPKTVPSGTILDFTTPEVDNVSSGTTYRIRCSNQYMTGEWTTYYSLNYVDLSYMVQNRKLLETDMIKLHQSMISITKGYDDYDSNLHVELSTMYPPKNSQGEYIVKATGTYLGSSGIIKKLNNLYDLVSKDSVPPGGLGLNFNQIDTNSINQVVVARNLPFSVSGGYYQPKGNYFNFIIDVLKNML